MQVVRAKSHGPPDVLAHRGRCPVLRPDPGQVLIRVDSAGVNFSDIKRRRNDSYPFPTPLPYTPGGEVAGTVEALGDGVDGPPQSARRSSRWWEAMGRAATRSSPWPTPRRSSRPRLA